jgi:hypothetical protein
MPLETFTHKGTDVSIRVKSQFGDTSGAQVSDDAILRWINDAQREIVNSNFLLRDTKYADIQIGVHDYSFPNDKVLLIEALYVDGKPIEGVTIQQAREFMLSRDPDFTRQEDMPVIWYERAGVITIYPKPNRNITAGLKIEYLKVPTDLTAMTDSLGVPDRYFNELTNYVIAQAMEMDENFSAATYKYSQFREGLNRLSYKDNMNQTDLYFQIVPDPEDY